MVTKVKWNINSVKVHPQLSNNRHPVDGVLVGAGSLWLWMGQDFSVVSGTNKLQCSLLLKNNLQEFREQQTTTVHPFGRYTSPSNLATASHDIPDKKRKGKYTHTHTHTHKIQKRKEKNTHTHTICWTVGKEGRKVGPPLHFPLPEWSSSPPVYHEGWMISDQETIFCWVSVPLANHGD